MVVIDIYNTPAMEAPLGQTTNFQNPESRATQFVATITACLAISALACGVRIFTKAYIMRQMRIEDYSLIFAELCFAAYAALTLRGLNYGEGRHLWDVSIADAQEFANLGNIGEILYSPPMFFAKLSVLKQLERIFVVKRDHIYWWIQAMIWVNAAFYLGIFVAFICACIPREKLWNPLIEGRCIDTGMSILATSGINIVSDWSILVLPALIIKRLQMNTQRKLGIIAIFSLGLLACIASIVRLVYSILFTKTKDQTWAIAPVSIWSYVEIATVILSCSFPIIPKFIQFLRFGHGLPGISHADSTPTGSGFKSNTNGGKKGGYLLHEDSGSRTDTSFGKQNVTAESRELDRLHRGITRTETITMTNELRRNNDRERDSWREHQYQQHPWIKDRI